MIDMYVFVCSSFSTSWIGLIVVYFIFTKEKHKSSIISNIPMGCFKLHLFFYKHCKVSPQEKDNVLVYNLMILKTQCCFAALALKDNPLYLVMIQVISAFYYHDWELPYSAINLTKLHCQLPALKVSSVVIVSYQFLTPVCIFFLKRIYYIPFHYLLKKPPSGLEITVWVFYLCNYNWSREKTRTNSRFMLVDWFKASEWPSNLKMCDRQ